MTEISVVRAFFIGGKMKLEYIKPDVIEINVSLNIPEIKSIQHALAVVEGIDDELRMFFYNLCLQAQDLYLTKIR